MYQKNLNLVRQRFPYLPVSDKGRSFGTDILVTVNKSKTGLPVAQVTRNNRRVFLNSSYDPELDAIRWVQHNLDANAGYLILCGAGFFYHVKALLESGVIKKLVIYEPNRAILEAAMHEIDLAPLFKYDNFLLLTGRDYNEIIPGALGFFNNGMIYTTADIQFKTLTAYNELFSEEIQTFQEKLREYLRLAQMNLSTTDAYAKQWLSNAFATFPNAVNSPVIRHYFGQFKNVPAIVVSAGPSLEKNIHLVNGIKEKAVVICAGSSIRAMKHNRVSPHFLVSVDGHKINSKVYGDLDLSDVYLVYNFRFWHEIASTYPGRKILMKVDAESLPDLFITQNGGYEIGSLKSGFSVSHTSLNLAYQLGCNPIILIGQDLAYAPTKRYADGQISSSQKHFKEGEIPPNCFYTKDIHGQDILTDYELDSFRMLLERMIETSYQGKVDIINATEGGIHIKGTTDRKLAEVIDEYCRENREISSRISTLYEKGLGEIRAHKIDPIGYCSKLQTITNRAIIKMAELIDELQALRQRNFNSLFVPGELDPALDQITNAYDQALNYKEYHVLLKDIQASSLSVNKARLGELTEIKTQEDYDKKLQIYLNIIADTQKALDFVMECITKVIDTGNASQGLSLVKNSPSASDIDIAAAEAQIKQRTGLKQLERDLETKLLKEHSLRRGIYLYLYGALLHRIGQTYRAVDILEEAVKIDSKQDKAYYQLYKIYYQNRNYSKALESLNHCLQLNFKTNYCSKMQLKIYYQTQNWVAACNLATDYENKDQFIHDHKLIKLIQIECLCRLGLVDEASMLYQRFISQYNVAPKIKHFLQELLDKEGAIEYRQVYQDNREFFAKTIGLHLPEYGNIQYKVCRFLSGEYVYDQRTDYILSGINHTAEIDMKLSLDDCLAIYNTDNTKIFEHLGAALERIGNDRLQQLIRKIPIYIIEDDLENWCLMAQLFDFRQLQCWDNLHYYIAPSGGITEIFLAEDIPWPNFLYGTNPEEFTKSLSKIKQKKDEILFQRVQELQKYYHEHQVFPADFPRTCHKIQVVYSIQDKVQCFYSRMIQTYLQEKGFECREYIESPEYGSFTTYREAKFLDEFRPDLIIHFFGLQEEFEVFKVLEVPFVSWLMAEKTLAAELTANCFHQRIFITGNEMILDNLLKKGYRKEQIQSVVLPVFSSPEIMIASNDLKEQSIAVLTDLENLDGVIHDLSTVIYGLICQKTHSAQMPNILAALRAIYFQVYARLSGQDEFVPIELTDYQEILVEKLQHHQLELSVKEQTMVAGFVKTEFENLIFKRIQVKWVADAFSDVGVAIYGSGWEQDPTYAGMYRGELNSLRNAKEYGSMVRKNKINLWLGNRLKNASYMQPDLVEGIAAGGFFMVGQCIQKDQEEDSIKPFQGLLESFGSKAELLEKIDFFLNHPEQRAKQAEELQNWVYDQFHIGKIIEKFWRLP
jgi:hypothetical protein